MKTLVLLIALLAAPALASAGPVTIQGGGTIIPIADVTVTGSATLVRAASGTRLTLSCTNMDTTVHVRWGSSTVTASSGQRIPSGASVEIRNIGNVYMISEGANVVVSCTEEAQ